MVLKGLNVKQEEKQSMVPFFSIWAGQAFSLLGSQLVQFALIWWLTTSTGSATVLATASLVGLLPQVVFGPIAGALVDRWNRRITMMVADSMIASATVGLAALFWAGSVQIWHIYLLMFVRAVAGSVHWPAMAASTSLMVRKEYLTRIQGLNQTLNGGLNILSAPLGAMLIELFPMQSILMIDVGTALFAILPLFFIAIPQPPQRLLATADRQSKSSVWQDFGVGLRYVRAWPGLVMLLLMATVINLVLNPASALTPILVTTHFRGGALQLGWINSAWGVGAVLGGLVLGIWGGFRRRIFTSLLGLIGMGLGFLLVGLAPASFFLLAVGATFMVGVMGPIVNGPLLAIIQAAVEPEMQGRVFTLIGSVSAGMSPLGLVIAGPVADTFGVHTWFVIGGIVTAVMGVLGFFIPAVVHVEDRQDQSDRVEAMARSAVVAD
jgi:DHA3 family macrolide efflux protein-like MFS transporter